MIIQIMDGRLMLLPDIGVSANFGAAPALSRDI